MDGTMLSFVFQPNKAKKYDDASKQTPKESIAVEEVEDDDDEEEGAVEEDDEDDEDWNDMDDGATVTSESTSHSGVCTPYLCFRCFSVGRRSSSTRHTVAARGVSVLLVQIAQSRRESESHGPRA